MECINLQGKTPNIKLHEAENTKQSDDKIPMTDPNLEADETKDNDAPEEIDFGDVCDNRDMSHMDSQYTPSIIAESPEDKLLTKLENIKNCLH